MPAKQPPTRQQKRASQRARTDSTRKYQKALVEFRGYQLPVFQDHDTKTLIVHWSRQIGKSFTLAAWAVDRCLKFPGRLVTVLSNSKDNGGEFALKAAEVARKLGQAAELVDLSSDFKYENMRFEVRITIAGKTSRIKVLAANPRTARGFSGDLILDEFAFHEDSRAIWEAAEPILSSNPDFLCRIASTGNGRGNMFHELIHAGYYAYYKMSRSEAWARGELKIYSMRNGKEITPDQARAEAADKAAYDQNYECKFNDENSALLRHEWITRAEQLEIEPDRESWSLDTLARMDACTTPLYFGADIGRSSNLTVFWMLTEFLPGQYETVGVLELEGRSLREQYREARPALLMPGLQRSCWDMTGLGLGLVEEAQEKHGPSVEGVNFASTEPVNAYLKSSGYKQDKAPVPALMATDMAEVFEDGCISIPANWPELRGDLRKPVKKVSPGNRVTIAATNDEEGHADRFWALALAIRAAKRKYLVVADPADIRTQAGMAESTGSTRRHFVARHISRS